ncbi:hypothetical protein HanRHA438_Chr01g0010041 [Helianthus annuus]|nr:hypothetical protein HanRHA438_Chr01g0010041 [Helianthus annuus]
MCLTPKSARFESSCITSHISMALQTIGDLFFLIATYQGHTYILNGSCRILKKFFDFFRKHMINHLLLTFRE